MKILTFSFVLASCFVFSQEAEISIFPDLKQDSIRLKKFNLEDFEKIQLDQKLAKNDSTIYQILVKKQENLELYSILCKKPELEKMIPIPNKNLEKRQKIKIMDPNEKSEINN